MMKVLRRGLLKKHLLAFLAVVLLVASAVGLVQWPPALGQTGEQKKEPPKIILVDPAKPKPAQPQAEVIDVMVSGVPGQEQVAYINQELERLWRENKLEPSERCSDYDFIRRASLDIIGRIARIEEMQKFLSDPPTLRRSMLIERLLDSEEFAHNLATVWTTLLMTRAAGQKYREQMQLYLQNEFSKKDAAWDKVTRNLLTATGKTNENGAVNFILAHLGEEFPQNEWEEKGRFQMVPVTSRTTKLFLGLQTQCTQCHDHPFWDVWKQEHFWGVNAFFRQVDAPLGRPMMMVNQGEEMFGGQKELTDADKSTDAGKPGEILKVFNKDGIIPYERRTGTVFYTKPRFLDGAKVAEESQKSRRQELADFVLKSPYFPKAFVNRTWGYFFGISFTKDGPADFGDHNPVTQPKLRADEPKDWLLERLAKDWATKYNYNPRDLVRWICNSRAYGLSSVANKTNSTRETDQYFSRMLLKAMSLEQLFESLMVATQSRAAQTSTERKELRERWLSRLVINFGDDEGNENTFNGTVVQALMLMNGQDINDAIMDKQNGTVAYVLNQPGITPEQAMRYLFLAALNRQPTAEEYQKIVNPNVYLMPRVPPPRTPQEVGEFWVGFYQDLFWAVLNSNEFFLNH